MSAALPITMQLTAALREIASALASPNTGALLTAEPVLARVVEELCTVTSIEPGARAAVFAELQRAHLELQRCRTLGPNAMDLVHAMLAPHGPQRYNSLGVEASTPAHRGGRMSARL
jgi:hypothetical protein